MSERQQIAGGAAPAPDELASTLQGLAVLDETDLDELTEMVVSLRQLANAVELSLEEHACVAPSEEAVTT